ncbi:TPA: hypothetical protein ACH3X1_012544 [Trebouxia sp. C0004]
MIQPKERKVVKGFIFDMDGTLTVPVIDFAEMRRRCGVMTGDVLDTIAGWPAEKQLVANQAIREVEQEALQHMQLMPGLLDLCSFLEAQGLPRQVVAGSRAGMDTILIDTLHNYTDRSALEGEQKPSHIVTSLAEIPELLQTYYCLERPAQSSASDNPAPQAAMKL